MKTKPQMTLKKACEIVKELNEVGYEARFGNNDNGKITIILDTYIEILPPEPKHWGRNYTHQNKNYQNKEVKN